MRPTGIEAAARILARLDGAAGLVIDADVHVTDPRNFEVTAEYFHGRPISAEDAIREMDMAGVDMALIWQNPAATRYGLRADDNVQALAGANRYVRDSAARYPDRFIPAGWLDPKACGLENTLALAETLVYDWGFPIVKLNPAQNRYAIDSPESIAAVDRIVELGAMPAFHFGADSPFTPAEGLRRVAERHPERPLIAVHMGGGGAGYLEAESLYAAARRLGIECPNIRYVLSAKRDPHMESDLIAYQLAGEPFCHHLFCGSDAPYGRMTWNFGGFRAMFSSLQNSEHTDARVRTHPVLFTAEAVSGYLGGNLARLVAEGCRRMVATGQPCSI
ncbi:MAG TPA: amidohydrolase family protein [Bryobacteraceae bacterium]|jgi:predicted TIM-barrel fold metal-dependent hydrolase